jgi:hypothetical protein
MCGFKLLILLVNSFPDVVNVITSNNTVLKQRKNYIDASFITVVIYKKVVLALTGFKTCLLLFSRFLELVDFSPNPVNVMCNNFLQQMEIDALEQLISEDVKVQGHISCVMVSELASWYSESSSELLSESSLELLPESSPEEMRSTTTTLLPESSLGESALTSMRVECFFLRVEEENHASPWQALQESANLALAHVYGFLPRADEEPVSSMEHRGRRTGAARWDGSSSSPRNLTLLAGAADSIEEDGCGRVHGASSLQNLPLKSRAIPTTETRRRRRRGRRKPEKGIEGRR